MACYTQEEIAERENLTQQAIDLILQEMASLPKLVKSDKSFAEHAADFDPPIYNIWKQRIFDLWLACHTQEEIAEKENVAKSAVNEICSEMADLPKMNKSDKSFAEHAADFDPPIYNIWKQQEKTPGSNHPGNSEVR